MKYSFKKTISMVLKILCAIAIIATAGSGEASAAKKTTNRKAKTTKVKKTRKRHQVLKEDERVVAAKNVETAPDNIIKELIPEFPVMKVEPTVVEQPMKMDVTSSVEPKKEEPKPNTEEIYTSAYRMPSFPGGDAALMKYISKNIRYPQMAKENGIQGKVVVQMVIMKNGRVGEVKVARSVDRDLDREAVRVCKSLPPFSPGCNANGDPVNVWYTLPVAFKLQGVD